MIYGAFIREVNKGAADAIVAYDSSFHQQGCRMYLGDVAQTIFVPFNIFTSCRSELVPFLQTRILGGLPDKAKLIVGMHDGVLTLENEESALN